VTAPVPDLLDSVLARYPGVLFQGEVVGQDGIYLVITDPDLNAKVTIKAATRHVAAGLALSWEHFRGGFLYGPRPCTCGRGYAMHLWDERSASKRGACPAPAGDRRYQPQDLAVLAGRETHDA
jgi:hypothetical protein